MEELCELADWINLMTYDYHSYQDEVTGSNAPICGTEKSWGVVSTLASNVLD